MARSAYPPAIEQLLPRAREIAEAVGRVPSVNRLKAELRIGTDKARAIRQVLAEPATTEPGKDIAVPNELGEEVAVPAEPAGDQQPEHVPTEVPDRPTESIMRPVKVLESPVASTPGTAPAEQPIARSGATRSKARRPIGRRHRVAVRVHQRHPARPAGMVYPAAPVLPVTADPGRRQVRSWPVLLLALPACVAIWSGWVGLGELAGFGLVHPLPGIWDRFQLNTAITLPVGVETYAAFALHVWLSSAMAGRAARKFAKWSAIGSLLLGMAGQGAYHLMIADGITKAPWLIVTAVSCLPVAVLGMGAALAHLIHHDDNA